MSMSIYIVVEQSAAGQMLGIVAAYWDETKANKHISNAKTLIPRAANKLEITKMELWDNREDLP